MPALQTLTLEQAGLAEAVPVALANHSSQHKGGAAHLQGVWAQHRQGW